MEPRQRLLDLYDKRSKGVAKVLAHFAPPEQRDELAAEARREFESMVDEIPYADRPDHSMFGPSFGVYQFLALYQAARARGYTAHQVGRAILATPFSRPPQRASSEALAKLRADAEASQRGAAPGEFVFQFVDGNADLDWGMNITSCAVCHAYARHDAMELVPYMCATDDKESDAGGFGLRRTGTLALGAHRCDFRYRAGGEPLPLAPQYPERIRLADD